jgi:hypothetical protein
VQEVLDNSVKVLIQRGVLPQGASSNDFCFCIDSLGEKILQDGWCIMDYFPNVAPGTMITLGFEPFTAGLGDYIIYPPVARDKIQNLAEIVKSLGKYSFGGLISILNSLDPWTVNTAIEDLQNGIRLEEEKVSGSDNSAVATASTADSSKGKEEEKKTKKKGAPKKSKNFDFTSFYNLIVEDMKTNIALHAQRQGQTSSILIACPEVSFEAFQQQVGGKIDFPTCVCLFLRNISEAVHSSTNLSLVMSIEFGQRLCCVQELWVKEKNSLKSCNVSSWEDFLKYCGLSISRAYSYELIKLYKFSKYYPNIKFVSVVGLTEILKHYAQLTLYLRDNRIAAEAWRRNANNEYAWRTSVQYRLENGPLTAAPIGFLHFNAETDTSEAYHAKRAKFHKDISDAEKKEADDQKAAEEVAKSNTRDMLMDLDEN